MANIKISELNPLLTVEDADVLPIVDNAVTKKVTAAILRSYTQGNSVLLTGAQTIAGIKTFTSQLASSVATGTAPFSVASTTKVTNLNADLLDGLSSADFALSTRTLTAGTGLTGGGDLTANRTFAIDGTVATLTGSQTLTNKTLTSPVINEILDSNGNEILGFTPIASATDYITIKNGIGVGVPVHISASGSSTNIGLHLEPKGSGLVQISDGTDTTKGIRFRSSGSATSAVTLIDAVSSAGRVITLPNATTTLVGTNTTDTLTNKSIAGDTNTLSNIGNASLTNSAITINGTSTSLGGSISVGTVTSVAALTLGTSGTDLSSTVATGTTTPVITLNVPTASASNRGALSSADWSTFNGKQNAITLTTTGTSGAATLVGSTLNIPNYADTDTGITSLNGLTALTQTFATGTSGTDFGISSATSTHTFNLPTASATNRGALSSADWTTFNNKQNALTNPVTGTGTTNYLPKFTGSTALGNSLVYDNGTNVGIGSTSANTRFHIKQNNNNYTGGLSIQQSDNDTALFIYNDGSKYIFGSTYGSTGAYVPLYFQTSDLNRLVIDINGNVGIGTTSPAAKLDVTVTGTASYSPSALPTASFNTTTTGTINAAYTSIHIGARGQFGQGQAVAITNVPTADGDSAMAFTTQNGYAYSEKMRITSAGNVQLQQGLSLSGATAPASGIEFPATQVASASANNLDDYEEGTFTATIAPSTSGTITSNATFTTWSYTKIGRQVTINGVFVISSTSLPIGINVIVGGLPFTVANSFSAFGALSATVYTSLTGLDTVLPGRHSFNTTQLTIGKDASTFSANDELYITATYFV